MWTPQRPACPTWTRQTFRSSSSDRLTSETFGRRPPINGHFVQTQPTNQRQTPPNWKLSSFFSVGAGLTGLLSLSVDRTRACPKAARLITNQQKKGTILLHLVLR